MENSVNLAIFFMLYFFITGIAMLINSKFIVKAVNEISKSSSNILIVGFISLIFGLFVISFHGFYAVKWPLLITIIGWLSVLKGTIYLFCEKKAKKLIKLFNTKWNISFAGGVNLMFAVYFFIALYI